MKKEVIYFTGNTLKNLVLYSFSYKNTGPKNKPFLLCANKLNHTINFPYLENTYIIR